MLVSVCGNERYIFEYNNPSTKMFSGLSDHESKATFMTPELSGPRMSVPPSLNPALPRDLRDPRHFGRRHFKSKAISDEIADLNSYFFQVSRVQV